MSRRAFITSAFGAALAACGAEGDRPIIRTTVPEANDADISEPEAPTATPTPVWTGTTETRLLLEGTRWATGLTIRDSGVEGPSVLVLGGVHGNEPGSWFAADQMVDWQPRRGRLLVAPRVNHEAIDFFERTLDHLGDMNRLFPGDPDSELPMERMAAETLDIAREYNVELLLDLHESWGFYSEYPPSLGYFAIGQTVTTGPGPRFPSFGEELAERVNPLFTQREQMSVIDGARYGRPRLFRGNHPIAGRSSLAAGEYVAGLTPVLIEMGQEFQEVERRTELHLQIVRAALAMMEMG